MRFALASIAAHASLVGAMAFFLAHDAGHVAGSAGLAGSPSTHFEVTMDAVVTPPAKSVPNEVKPLAVNEGLPVDVKNETREIDEAPPPPPKAAEAVPSEGNSASAPAGATGQGGSGTEVAAKIGDSDRTNRFGLYLQKMHRKIQSNLVPPGYLQFPVKARLILDLKKDGSVAKITVAESTGDAALDRIAIRAVQKSNPFDPWDEDREIHLPVVFR